jgi:hypothetical protein
MFIGQGSSIVGVCVVYGLSSLVQPLIDEKEKRQTKRRRERI